MMPGMATFTTVTSMASSSVARQMAGGPCA
jgi:hypothetical protein